MHSFKLHSFKNGSFAEKFILDYYGELFWWVIYLVLDLEKENYTTRLKLEVCCKFSILGRLTCPEKSPILEAVSIEGIFF